MNCIMNCLEYENNSNQVLYVALLCGITEGKTLLTKKGIIRKNKENPYPTAESFKAKLTNPTKEAKKEAAVINSPSIFNPYQ